MQEVVLRVGAGAGATHGMLERVRPSGNRECRGVADGGACVSEVLAGGGGGENIRYR